MNVVIRFTEKAEEVKALAILLRHSPGTVLPDRTYVIQKDAADALRAAGVGFVEVARDASPSSFEGIAHGERI